MLNSKMRGLKKELYYKVRKELSDICCISLSNTISDQVVNSIWNVAEGQDIAFQIILSFLKNVLEENYGIAYDKL